MDKKIREVLDAPNGQNTNLLRIGVVFLSVVSFYTTANGMREYIFIDNGPVAYAASAAIQGILLALSMNLPGYLKNICEKPGKKKKKGRDWGIIGRFIVKSILCLAAVFLTLVTIFCSSWFSYVYIADVIHKDSWGMDSELLVQQTYRTELYNAQDYAHAYRIYLEEAVGERILLLEEQAAKLSDSVADLNMDWNAEKSVYAPNDGSTGARYMATVIDAMENAMNKAQSQEDRDLAVTAVSDAKANITNRMTSIQQNLDTLDNNISSYRMQVDSLNNQIARAQEGVDTTPLRDSVNTYLRLINDIVQQQGDLQTEYRTLESALDRLSLYESRLGLSSSTSAISIRSNLMQLQSEFFQQEPDEAQMLALATDIFDSLRNASRTASETTENTENALSYTNLLLQMNWLIRNLTDYSEIKDIESTIEDLIDELRTVEFTDKTEPDRPTNPEEDASPDDTDGTDDELQEDQPVDPEEDASPDDTDGTDDELQEDQPTDSEEDASPDDTDGTDDALQEDQSADSEGDASHDDTDGTDGAPQEGQPTGSEEEASHDDTDDAPQNTRNSQWKQEWGERLAALKAQISALPVYSETEETGDGISSILTESQVNLLRSYDRSRSSRELDDMIRRYISGHNAIYSGILYLQSPYRSLAIFAMVLALAFDLSGFIFGFVAQGSDEGSGQGSQDTEEKNQAMANGTNTDSDNPTDEDIGNIHERNQIKTRSLDEDMESQTDWSILKTLTTYVVLTGDYEYQDGNYVYTVFKDGLRCHWPVKDKAPYSQGIYIAETIDDDWMRGTSIPTSEQDILLAAQAGGPQDGIYVDCQLTFDDGSLILVRGDMKTFLANIDEYVPVHVYSPARGENQTIPAKQLAAEVINADSAVVALNSKGTRVAVIYIIEQS